MTREQKINTAIVANIVTLAGVYLSTIWPWCVVPAFVASIVSLWIIITT